MMLKFYFFLAVLVFSFRGRAQEIADTVNVLHEEHWCSKDGEFETTTLRDRPNSKCNDSPFTYGKWFKFKATSSSMEAILHFNGVDETIQFPYISLYDHKFGEIACKKSEDHFDKVILSSLELKKGKWYYLLVSNHNHSKYVGSFTLCLRNKVSYNQIEGAIKIKDLNRWCTSNVSISTLGATANGPKASCLNKGPNFNRWFVFKADGNYLKVKARPTSYEGSFQFPYLAIFDEQLQEVACGMYNDNFYDEDIFIETEKLIDGKTYYLSVDHKYNHNYTGSFKLCFDNANEEISYTLVGRILDDEGTLPDGKQVTLVNNEGQTIAVAELDEKGKFKFAVLPKHDAVKIKMEKNAPDLNLEYYVFNENNGLMQKIKGKVEDQNFVNPNVKDPDATIMEDRSSFKDYKGKPGVFGKIIRKNDPFETIEGVDFGLYKNPGSHLKSVNSKKDGAFSFTDLDKENDILVKLQADSDEDYYVELVYVDEKGRVAKTANSSALDENGFFHFNFLPHSNESLAMKDVEDVELPDIEVGDAVVLGKVKFAKNSSDLLDESFTQLMGLVKKLEDRSIKVKVIGYTDNLGSQNINLKLSKQRAKTVVDYLIREGVQSWRLSYDGYGSSNPIADNSTEQGRQINRRVEVLILEN